MATYNEIINYIKISHSFTVKTCWIADIKSQYGLTNRIAHNRIDVKQRTNPCPTDKKEYIINALKHFEMI